METNFRKYIYENQNKLYKILDSISIVNFIYTFCLLVYRFGFILGQEEKISIVPYYHYYLNIYIIIFSLKILFSLDRKSFLRENMFELVICSFFAFHNSLNLLFDFKIIIFILEYFEIGQLSSIYRYFIIIYILLFISLEILRFLSKIANIALKPALLFIFSFIVLILLGAIMLMFPAMTQKEVSISFLDALFTAASASCVTGLIVVDTATFFTFKGQLIILLLIQLGGIGIITFATFFASILSSKMGLKHQSIMQDFLSSDSLFSTKKLLKRVIIITVSIEFIGAILIFFSWHEELIFNSFNQKIFFSIFHSISAFCNAGMSLFSNGLFTSSLSTGEIFTSAGTVDMNVRNMYGLHFIIIMLVILGGLGFNVIEDIFSMIRKKLKKNKWGSLRTGSRLAIYSSVLLLLIGSLAFIFFELYKFTDRNLIQIAVTSFFQSATTRTAGFNTIDFSVLTTPTIITCIFLMFIGASPGSTGGGIKGTTFYLILLSAIEDIRGKKRITINKRTIPNELIHRAYSIFMFASSYNLLAIFLLSLTEEGNPNIEIIELVFEQISAFSTVGLSLGITADISSWGKMILISSMYIGRVGTITLALALSKSVGASTIKYPQDHVMIG